MSHFLRIRTLLRERQPLLQALRDLALPFEEGAGLTVRGDSRRPEPADIVVRTGSSFDVGLRKAGDEYEVVADWYRVEQATSLRREEFTAALSRQYALNVVRDQAREQGLIVEEERTEGGEIIIVLSERG